MKQSKFIINGKIIWAPSHHEATLKFMMLQAVQNDPQLAALMAAPPRR